MPAAGGCRGAVGRPAAGRAVTPPLHRPCLLSSLALPHVLEGKPSQASLRADLCYRPHCEAQRRPARGRSPGALRPAALGAGQVADPSGRTCQAPCLLKLLPLLQVPDWLRAGPGAGGLGVLATVTDPRAEGTHAWGRGPPGRDLLSPSTRWGRAPPCPHHPPWPEYFATARKDPEALWGPLRGAVWLSPR